MIKITEGLQTDDLKDLVLPIVSIDEFESKISENAIVVAFYVTDKAPAQDLNRFLQKSAIELLDVDTSPVSDENGFYLVFVELNRNSGFSDRIIAITKSLGSLTGIDEWQFKGYHQSTILPMTKENIENTISMSKIQESQISDFLKESIARSIKMDGSTVNVNNRATGNIIDFGHINVVMKKNGLMNMASRLDESAWSETSKWMSTLGNNWSADMFGDNVLLTKNGSDSALLLSPRKVLY